MIRDPIQQQVSPALEEREVPRFTGRTYRDLVEYALRQQEANFMCEADKAAARHAAGTRPE